MDFGMLGGILGGLGQLAGGVGGLFKGGGNNDWNSQQMQMQMQLAREQLAFQKEAATSGIRWKVADAKGAGVHPLFALGASTFQPSPVSVGPVGDNSGGGGDVGGSLANMGQGIGRAVAATQTTKERAAHDAHVSDMLMSKQIEKLDSEILLNKANADRALRNAAGTPGFPNIAAPTVHGPAEMVPPEVNYPNPGNPGYSAGPPTPGNRSVAVDRSGAVVTLPDKSLNLDEASSPGWTSWMMRNRVWPWFSTQKEQEAAPPQSHLPPGAVRWKITPFGWEPVYSSNPHMREYNPRHYNRHQRSDSY